MTPGSAPWCGNGLLTPQLPPCLDILTSAVIVNQPSLIIWVTLQSGLWAGFVITNLFISSPHNTTYISHIHSIPLKLFSHLSHCDCLPRSYFISWFRSSFQISESISFVPRQRVWWLEKVSQIKFPPLGRGHCGTVEGEREQRKLQGKRPFPMHYCLYPRGLSGSNTNTPIAFLILFLLLSSRLTLAGAAPPHAA